MKRRREQNRKKIEESKRDKGIHVIFMSALDLRLII